MLCEVLSEFSQPAFTV